MGEVGHDDDWRAGTLGGLYLEAPFGMGLPVEEVARRMGVSAGRVSQLVRRYGLPLRQVHGRRKGPLPPGLPALDARPYGKGRYLDDPGWLLTQYVQRGWTVVEIVEVVSIEERVGRKDVLDALERAGIPRRSPGRRRSQAGLMLAENPGWLAGRLDAGRSMPQIAGELGCEVHTVAYWVHVHGLRGRRVRGG